MQALLDSPEIRRRLIELKTFALSHPVDLQNGIPADLKPVGDDPKHVILNGTMRIVYSVELQPSGQCHHLSVSKQGGTAPNPGIVDYIMDQLGMGKLKDQNPKRHVSIEHGYAVNVVQIM